MYQNIIITGASNGLGMAMAKCYAAPGICLGLIGRNKDRLNQISDFCKHNGATVESASIDIRNTDILIEWITKFDYKHPVDLLIANAGVMHTTKPNNPRENNVIINEMFDINFNGVINTVNPILDRMTIRKSGSIAIVSSLATYYGIPSFPAYSASKAATKTYFEAIRGFYCRQGIYISIVCPSYINTDMTKNLKVNKFMLTSPEAAANRISRGIANHKLLISFPWYHSFGMQVLRLLPERLADKILLLILNK